MVDQKRRWVRSSALISSAAARARTEETPATALRGCVAIHDRQQRIVAGHRAGDLVGDAEGFLGVFGGDRRVVTVGPLLDHGLQGGTMREGPRLERQLRALGGARGPACRSTRHALEVAGEHHVHRCRDVAGYCFARCSRSFRQLSVFVNVTLDEAVEGGEHARRVEPGHVLGTVMIDRGQCDRGQLFDRDRGCGEVVEERHLVDAPEHVGGSLGLHPPLEGSRDVRRLDLEQVERFVLELARHLPGQLHESLA